MPFFTRCQDLDSPTGGSRSWQRVSQRADYALNAEWFTSSALRQSLKSIEHFCRISFQHTTQIWNQKFFNSIAWLYSPKRIINPNRAVPLYSRKTKMFYGTNTEFIQKKQHPSQPAIVHRPDCRPLDYRGNTCWTRKPASGYRMLGVQVFNTRIASILL